MQGTAAQLRRLRDERLRDGERDLTAARDARSRAQERARTLEEYAWDAKFYAMFDDTRNTRRVEGLLDNVPRLQRVVDMYWRQAQELEASGVAHLDLARKAAAALAHRERKAAPREEPGWWTLVRLCWQGWRKQRARV